MLPRRITVYFGIFIIISASFTGQVTDFAEGLIGDKGFALFMAILMAGSAFLFFIHAAINKLPIVNMICISFVLAGILAFIWHIRLPAEKIHILEYTILGYLTIKDLAKPAMRLKGIFFTFLFCCIISASDELFQAVLPYRTFDTQDIIFNNLGSFWGVVLYLLR